jgi:hypothetical protein
MAVASHELEGRKDVTIKAASAARGQLKEKARALFPEPGRPGHGAASSRPEGNLESIQNAGLFRLFFVQILGFQFLRIGR